MLPCLTVAKGTSRQTRQEKPESDPTGYRRWCQRCQYDPGRSCWCRYFGCWGMYLSCYTKTSTNETSWTGFASCSCCRCRYFSIQVLEEAPPRPWNVELHSSVETYPMYVIFFSFSSPTLTLSVPTDSFYKNIVLYVTQFWVRLSLFRDNSLLLISLKYSSRSLTISLVKSLTNHGHCPYTTSFSLFYHHSSLESSINSFLLVS